MLQPGQVGPNLRLRLSVAYRTWPAAMHPSVGRNVARRQRRSHRRTWSIARASLLTPARMAAGGTAPKPRNNALGGRPPPK